LVADLQWLTCEDFIELVGQGFDVAADDGSSHELRLVQATEGGETGGPGPEGQVRQQFSLVFLGSGNPGLAQGTYRLSHPQLGELELFLVPLGPVAEGMQYEAAFA
jgi:hypothetical protein